MPKKASEWLDEARKQAGEGSTEEKLERLMCWMTDLLPSTVQHSSLKDPVKVLNSGTAWCDQLVIIFLWVAHHLFSLPGRALALKHNDGRNGHCVAEVLLNSSWCLFDVHHKHVYRDPASGAIMGYREICANVNVVITEGSWWLGYNKIGKEGFYTDATLHSGMEARNDLAASFVDFDEKDYVA